MFSLYVHVPYCLQKCPYCSFNSVGTLGSSSSDLREVVLSGPKQQGRYVDCLLKELDLRLASGYWLGNCDTAYVGGGTPSILHQDELYRLLAGIRARLRLPSSAEITIEVNPSSLGHTEQEVSSKLAAIRDAGFNRISIGVQSFSAEKLSFLGRLHTPQDSELLCRIAREQGFTNICLDLIFGTVIDSETLWRADIAAALNLHPQHMSCYALSVERGTEFYRREKIGTNCVGDDRHVALQYNIAGEILESAGYQRYEVSNYATRGFESRHNSRYWDGTSYIGLGAGAHGYINSSHDSDPGEEHDGTIKPPTRYMNVPSPDEYMLRVESDGEVTSWSEMLTPTQQKIEFLMLRLRTKQGFSINGYREHLRRFLGPNIDEREISSLIRTAQCLHGERLVVFDGDSIALTSRAMPISDSVIQCFIDAL